MRDEGYPVRGPTVLGFSLDKGARGKVPELPAASERLSYAVYVQCYEFAVSGLQDIFGKTSSKAGVSKEPY